MVIEPIINSHKIKYKILTKLVNENFKNEGNTINIYINIDSILSSLYRENILEGIRDLKGYNNISLSSEMVNIVAHYRNFFWSYYKVYSKIYLYTLNKRPAINSTFVKEYCEEELHRFSENNPEYGVLNRNIKLNMKLMTIVCAHVHDCYLLPSDGLEPTLIPFYIMSKNKSDNEYHLIITKDKFDYQLLNLCKNTFLLKLKYDESYLITKDDLYDHKFKDINYRPNIEINPKLYSLFLALNGAKSKSVKGIKGIGFSKFIKTIEKNITSGDIVNDYTNNMYKIADMFNLDFDNTTKLINNFKAIDLFYNLSILSKVDKQIIKDKLINRYDMNGLFELNEKYYKNNPLQIIELNKGCKG